LIGSITISAAGCASEGERFQQQTRSLMQRQTPPVRQAPRWCRAARGFSV